MDTDQQALSKQLRSRVRRAGAAASSLAASHMMAGRLCSIAMRTARPSAARASWIGATRGLALPAHTVVGMPALSPTMTSGNVAKYIAKVGDELTVGDRLAEIETDKATVDFESAISPGASASSARLSPDAS